MTEGFRLVDVAAHYRVIGKMPAEEPLRKFLDYVIGILVVHPEAVAVEHEFANARHVFRLHLHDEDVGRVIGKDGFTISSIRSLMNAAAEKNGEIVILKVENEKG